MGQIIAVTSQKGGVGKTTVSLNLAVAMAEKLGSTVLVDVDPQGAVGLALARGDTALAGLAEIVVGASTLEQALMTTKLPRLTLLPRGRLDPIDVVTFEHALAGKLHGVLTALRGKFEYVIVDTPAGLGVPTRATLAAADWALLPVQAEPMGLRSIQQALRVVEHVRAKENPRLRLLGLLMTMVELKREGSREVAEALWSGFGGVMETMLPRAEVFMTASQKGLPLAFLSGPTSPEARRFELLAAEIDGLITSHQGAHEATERKPERQLL